LKRRRRAEFCDHEGDHPPAGGSPARFTPEAGFKHPPQDAVETVSLIVDRLAAALTDFQAELAL